MAGAATSRENGFLVVVQVSPACPDMKLKLESYFQSKKKSNGGECRVERTRKRNTYEVYFKEAEAYERVLSKKDHILDFPSSSPVKVSIHPLQYLDENLEASEMKSLMEKQDEAAERQNSTDALSQKIFLHISARLNTNLFSKDQRQNIKTLFPNLKIVKDSDNLGIEEVSGDFTDLEEMHHYLEGLYLGKQEDPSLKKGGSLSSKETDNEIYVDVALYEYVMYVCQNEIEELQSNYNVHMKRYDSSDSQIVIFVPLEGKNYLSKAHEKFISIYQKITEDLAQERVPLSVNQSQADKMAKLLNAKFPRVLAKVEKNVLILIGPKHALPHAKTYLEKMNIGESQPAKPIRITPKDCTWEKGIEIDERHCGLLETVLAEEIKAIECKYNSDLEKSKSIFSSNKVNIQFKPKNKDSDLYLFAYESFISAFQRVMTSLVKKSCSVQSAEQDQKLKLSIDQLQRENKNVAFNYSSGTLTMTGLPQHLVAAVAQVAHCLNDSARGQAASIRLQATTGVSDQEEPMDVEGDHDFIPRSLNSTAKPKSEGATGEKKEDTCPICLDKFEEKIVLSKCKHEFCKDCIDKAMAQKPVCPVCSTHYGTVVGNQPEGTMSWITSTTRLPDYNCGTITINYQIPSGIQTENHPHPGKRFTGTNRTAYLPNNKEGQKIVNLLNKAFAQKLIFTVGQSRTSGSDDVVTWNDIHHKTNIYGGPAGFGYPDPDYLKRVQEELKAKGIE